MERIITSLSVAQTGKVLAAFYGLLSLIMLPFVLIAVLLSGKVESVLPMLIMVVLYPIMGFIGGMLLAVFYNISANWVGGLVVTVEQSEFE
ncbi:hypothetical protein [Bythopirellula goksoeyrii]|uniref:DUF3566 domain-containing protein n=1 Tax=Bythopirellula goksoeyrii TaxID=1400387 RepID=A0A5B9Q7X5_9BACT|nr:hypothetical protein [Bythopirellula goksoeyrii]QEG33675.1 hypothetical protein Pr1d_09390 [Bythopirellula goksoeyrii]